jgi:hypothetical protein
VSLTAVAGAGAAKSPVPAAPAAGPAPGKAAPALPAAAALAGSQIVSSGLLTAPTGGQTRGVAFCPSTKVPLGGGVFVTSSSTAANVNSSFPQGNGWVADVNNASGADTTFAVSVVCARRPRNYSIVESAGVTNVAGRQDFDSVTCPTGSRPLGGGAESASFDLAVNMNTTVPDGPSWDVDMNNASANDTSFNTFAVCGHVRGYTITNGGGVTTDNPPNSQSLASTTCPALTHAIGGGVFSNLGSVLVNINTTAISGTTAWDSYMNNASPFDAGLVTIAICAS